ncbi:MAG: glucose-6-phosphate dehydrogenase, partial [Acidobacteriota bacterium]
MSKTEPLTYVGEPAQPCVMVIFGATGDLTKRKLFPALYNLAKANLLSREFAIVCTGRNDLTTEAFREQISADIKTYATAEVDANIWDWFLNRIYYVSGDVTNPESYQKLKAAIEEADKAHGTHGNYFFYLAISPNFFGETVRQLGAASLAAEENGQWRRVIIEKPFGRDLDSAQKLNAEIRLVLDERQIYRIDHYLGKETVQNILVFRFGNGIFEPIWNRRYIDSVQITAAETVGV